MLFLNIIFVVPGSQEERKGNDNVATSLRASATNNNKNFFQKRAFFDKFNLEFVPLKNVTKLSSCKFYEGSRWVSEEGEGGLTQREESVKYVSVYL
jgi:hypothetical protein